MDAQYLVKMANQIAGFFSAYPDEEDAVSEVANHMRRFWDPRMRQALMEHVDAGTANGLSALAESGIRRAMERTSSTA